MAAGTKIPASTNFADCAKFAAGTKIPASSKITAGTNIPASKKNLPAAKLLPAFKNCYFFDFLLYISPLNLEQPNIYTVLITLGMAVICQKPSYAHFDVPLH